MSIELACALLFMLGVIIIGSSYILPRIRRQRRCFHALSGFQSLVFSTSP